jgi:hypothetical protein
MASGNLADLKALVIVVPDCQPREIIHLSRQGPGHGVTLVHGRQVGIRGCILAGGNCAWLDPDGFAIQPN